MPTSKVVPAAPRRERLIADLLPLARRLAGRYRHSGESRDDLVQVAYLGAVKAVDRYEPDRGPLIRYAVPTILGELRRHFRDNGWGTHVPRSVQENLLEVTAAVDRLSTRLGRTPTARDVAEQTGIDVEDVLYALDAARSYTPAHLDAPVADDEPDGRPLGDTLATEERHYELIELGEAAGPTFRALPERERAIVRMRFLEDMTQSEIAAELGISQMHVSRLLRRALDAVRAAVDEAPPCGAAA